MNKSIFLTLIFLFLSITSYTQSISNDTIVLVVNDTIQGGEFSIELDKTIAEKLAKKEDAVCSKPVVRVPTPERTEPKSSADICVNQQKIMGYKIQIFYTKDRNLANSTRAEFSRQFPSLRPELIYASPDFRILAGDYFTRKSAGRDLRNIQKKYPGAFLVKWRVWCRKAI